MRYRAPLFNRVTFAYFIYVGLCPTRFLPVHTKGVGFDREEEGCIDRVDTSPRDHQSKQVRE